MTSTTIRRDASFQVIDGQDHACAAVDLLATQLKIIIKAGRRRGKLTITFKPGALTSAELTTYTGDDDGWKLMET